MKINTSNSEIEQFKIAAVNLPPSAAHVAPVTEDTKTKILAYDRSAILGALKSLDVQGIQGFETVPEEETYDALEACDEEELKQVLAILEKNKPAFSALSKIKGVNMNKYTSQFNELIVLAKDEKTKKKGGSMAAILKLVMELAEFEGNIQEAIDAQEIAENRGQIEGFLTEIDKMYEVLLNMAKSSIQAMRTERSQPEVVEGEEGMDAAPAPATHAPEESSRFTTDDLRKQLEAKPTSPISLTIPRPPRG